jgi:hypothetical protein
MYPGDEVSTSFAQTLTRSLRVLWGMLHLDELHRHMVMGENVWFFTGLKEDSDE